MNLNFFLKNKWSIVKILLIFLIFLYFIFRSIIFYQKEQIINNWNSYKCKLYIAPFSGLIKPEKGKSAIEVGIKNTLSCLWIKVKIFFQILIKPFQYIISIITKIIGGIKDTLNKFRQQLSVIRQFLLKIVQTVMDRLQNLLTMFISEFLRMRDILKRNVATFQNLVFTIETMGLTMKSMMDGPVGDMAHIATDLGKVFTFFLLGPISFLMFPSLWFCTVCFSKNTLIKIDNKTNIQISKLTLGDNIYKTSIDGLFLFNNHQKYRFYKLDNDLITGNHLVIDEFNNYIQVKDINESLLTDVVEPYLYCLSTTNNIIPGIKRNYCDWENIKLDKEFQIQKNTLLALLNPFNLNIKYSDKHCYQEGFPFITKKKINFDLLKKIIQDDKEKSGVSICKCTQNIIWYQSFENKLIVSGSTIIYCVVKKMWIPVYLCSKFKKLDRYNIDYIIHFTTKNNTFSYKGYLFRDLLEINNDNYHKKFNY